LVYALLGDGECKKAKTGEAGIYASAVDVGAIDLNGQQIGQQRCS
jgi:transketolase N-terminal domain/subunit